MSQPVLLACWSIALSYNMNQLGELLSYLCLLRDKLLLTDVVNWKSVLTITSDQRLNVYNKRTSETKVGNLRSDVEKSCHEQS